MSKYENKTGLPSVSDIIAMLEDRRWFTDAHRDRGSLTHGWIQGDLLGLFTPTPCEAIAPYIKSYLEFKKHIVKVHFVEKRLTSAMGYTGQIDLVADMDDVYNNWTVLLDWKTSVTKYITWGARFGGYWNLLREHSINVDGALCVRLRKKPIKKGWFPLVDVWDSREMKENYMDFWAIKRVYDNMTYEGTIFAPLERETESPY